MVKQHEVLLDAASRPYRPAGKFAWHFARGKLRHDPFYFSVLRRGMLPDAGRLFDVGCGQGLLLALLTAAHQEFQLGRWPLDWPAPPRHLEMRGIELERRRVEIARQALERLGASADLRCEDVREADFPKSSVIAIIDVLLYLDPDAQHLVLKKAVDALRPNGLLILREADRRAGWRFQMTCWSERLLQATRGRFRQQLYYRAAGEWRALLEELGLVTHVQPMSAGTPFANMLFVGRARCSSE
jgi:SAM-dependent methyltransferase